MEKTDEMGTKKIIPLILKYSLPAIIGMTISAIYNIVDRIFVGNSLQIGSLGIARDKYNLSYLYFTNGYCIFDWDRWCSSFFNVFRRKEKRKSKSGI